MDPGQKRRQVTFDPMVVATVVGTVTAVPAGIWGLVVQVNGASRAAARDTAEREQAAYDRGHAEGTRDGYSDGYTAGRTAGISDGRAAMQPTIDLITYQLAEAVRDRNDAERRARDMEKNMRHRDGGGV